MPPCVLSDIYRPARLFFWQCWKPTSKHNPESQVNHSWAAEPEESASTTIKCSCDNLQEAGPFWVQLLLLTVLCLCLRTVLFNKKKVNAKKTLKSCWYSKVLQPCKSVNMCSNITMLIYTTNKCFKVENENIGTIIIGKEGIQDYIPMDFLCIYMITGTMQQPYLELYCCRKDMHGCVELANPCGSKVTNALASTWPNRKPESLNSSIADVPTLSSYALPTFY